MRNISIISFIAFSLFVSGCSRPGHFPRNVSVDEIVKNVKCELLQAVQENLPYSPWLKDWTSQVDLFLEVERGWGPSGEVDIVTPIHNGVFSLGLSSAISRTATNSITIKFLVTDLTDFKSYGCPLHESDGKRGRLLAGETGLRQWLSHAVDGMERNDVFADSPGITYKLNFLLTASGSITPGIDVTNPTGTRVRASLGLGGAKAKTHTLTIAMTKKPGDSAQIKQLKRIANALERKSKIADAKSKSLGGKATKLQKKATDARKAADAALQEMKKLESQQTKLKLGLQNQQMNLQRRRTDQLKVNRLSAEIRDLKPKTKRVVDDADEARAMADTAKREAESAAQIARSAAKAAFEAASAAAEAEAVRQQLLFATRRQLNDQILQEIFRDSGRRR